MIVMVISFLSSGVYALNFSFESPESVELGKEFEVRINGTTEDIYDVKIYVHDDVKTSSEIYDGANWKSTRFYLKDVFPEQEIFKLKAYFLGETEICFQMRKSGGSSFDKSCGNITVLEVDDNGNNQSDEEDEETNKSEENNKTVKTDYKNDINMDLNELNNQFKEDEKQIEKIILSAPSDGNSEDKTAFVSKQELVRTGVLYGFLSLMVLIVIFLALRKL